VWATVASVALLTAFLPAPAFAGSPTADIPTPESVLGFRPGADRHLADWDQVLAYLGRLDAASGRVTVEEVGRTTQGRPFVLTTVTSEANHARLEEIRQTNLRLADPRGLSEEEAERLVDRGRAIVAMAFSIHSTEVGGTLASLRLLHHLAASDAPDVHRALDETVLLVLPSHNPDGTQLPSRAHLPRCCITPTSGTTTTATGTCSPRSRRG
jgi:murein tripeptide amidase MpaA